MNESPQRAQQQQPLSIHCPRPLRATRWNTEAVPPFIQSSPTIARPQNRLPSQVIQPAHSDTSQYPNSPGPYQHQAGFATHNAEAKPKRQPYVSNRAPSTGNFARFETHLIEQDWNGVVTPDGRYVRRIPLPERGADHQKLYAGDKRGGVQDTSPTSPRDISSCRAADRVPPTSSVIEQTEV
ncbi:hypothetical protein CPB84DRAFT_1767933 [Gymnopilus junonius]|uniref:Uncharacterized protein n=1 Tax=Gymnopilus junonius TaxID=109634 RepID=A0A9P5NSV1_GYMJU|nr:hypothetical protein CPB84DRAFT_1767933 [Gymnopilus junonius]